MMILWKFTTGARRHAAPWLLVLSLYLANRRGLASAPELRQPPGRIAIVGAGIGGAATAAFLRKEFGPQVQIDVFEGGKVGGRLDTAHFGGKDFETGGSVIHPLNLHMKQFIDDLGLAQRRTVPSRIGIFNGKELVFQESDWFIINFIKILWRYGLNFLRMQMWVEAILDKFMRIYQYQQYGYSFSSVERLFHSMARDEFLNMFNETLDQAMQKVGFSQQFMNEIVTPIMRVNYGQSIKMNAFVGAVSLAGTDSGLWAVEGGNKLVCSGLLYHSKAALIPANVTAIALKTRPVRAGGTVSLYEVSYSSEAGASHNLYDLVFIAAPLHQGKSNINFLNFNPPVPMWFPGRYHLTVSTLVHGLLNVSYFGVSEPASAFTVSEIVSMEHEELVVTSVSSLDPVTVSSEYKRPPASEANVWKVFSPAPLTQDQLQKIFLSWDSISETRWLAYPYYSPPHRFPPIVLHDRLYYLNGIEWAASAMEMSAIAARNLALLAHHHWYGLTDKIDQEDLNSRIRGEL
ncbi:prenylcysteine oxidase 1 [Erpetoichthys calabaricus]|uniref:Prenylcysteine oxidase 1 n=1 Tax=Erpetoichthys calabaricus TaxID=27687 RepID=A0A8C4RDF0_ERPCA|nr:prenylcysteine oxidase 1 [Erpetoichthys calabaricus]